MTGDATTRRPVGGRLVEFDRPPDLRRAYARAVTGAWARTGTPPHAVDPSGPPTVVAHGVRAQPAGLSAYQHLMAEPGVDDLPPGYVHVLAFPVSMAVLTDQGFALPVLGLVHVANRVEQRRPVRCGEAMTVTAWAGPVQPHRRGRSVDLVTEVAVDGEPVWVGTSTYLARSRGAGRGKASPDGHPATPARTVPSAPGTAVAPGTQPHGAGGEPTGHWQVGRDRPRDYATVSGDRNPIHLSRAAARLFGFRSVIMHGMDSASRLLAGVGAARGPSFRWDVEFGAPIVLPASVAVRVVPDAGGWAMTAWRPSDGRRHVTARLGPRP